jgi:hypothetical protein
LEATVHLAVAILTVSLQGDVVPGRLAAAAALEQELTAACPDGDVESFATSIPCNQGHVDDWWCTFEWSGGGIVHIHLALYTVGSPRIDKVLTDKALLEAEDEDPGAPRETLYAEEGDVVLQDDAAARALVTIASSRNACKGERDVPGRVGYRKAMGKKAERSTPSPDMLSADAMLLLLDTREGEGDAEAEERIWEELAQVLDAGAFAKDWDSVRAGSDVAPTSRKLFPRKVISAGAAEISEDPRRRELYRLWLARNCHFINNLVPVLTMAT